MLDTTIESVKSALKRARARLQRRRLTVADREPPPAADSSAEDAIVAKFVSAYESADIDGAGGPADRRRLHVDATAAPRIRGSRRRGRLLRRDMWGAGRRFDPCRRRGQPRPAGVRAYLRAPDGIRHGTGLFVLTLAGDRICAMTRFENSVLPSFGLAPRLDC